MRSKFTRNVKSREKRIQPPFLEEKRKNERKNKKRENKITKPICVTALVKLHSVFAL